VSKGFGTLWSAVFCLVCTVAQAWGGLHTVKYVEIENKPELVEGQLLYRLSIVFDIVPEHFFVYYDNQNQQIVLDCYGATMRAADISMEGSAIFTSFSVVNSATNMSLTGEQAQVRIGADPGWNIEAVPQQDNSIRIVAQRELTRKIEPEKFNWQVPLMIAAPVVAGLGAFAIIWTVSQNRP